MTSGAAQISAQRGLTTVFLGIFVVWLIAAPILSWGGFYATARQQEGANPALARMPEWSGMWSLVGGIVIFRLAVAVAAWIGIANRNSKGLKTAKIAAWLSWPIADSVLLFGMYFLFVGRPERATFDNFGRGIGPLFGSLVIASGWTIYLTYSKQIAERFSVSADPKTNYLEN